MIGNKGIKPVIFLSDHHAILITYSFIKVTITDRNKEIGRSEMTQKVFIDEKEKRKNKKMDDM